MRKILIIEDNSRLTEMLKESFEEVGYSVTVALEGTEGLNLVETVKPNVVILDMRLQNNLDGLEIYKIIIEKCPNMPVIIYTAFEEYRETRFQISAGKYCTFILKPVPIEKLIMEVERVIGDCGKEN
ncbi:MAG: response regulator [Elusimicrobia bacterium]|nr:response regulator [Elusimicrobiota bacterium]